MDSGNSMQSPSGGGGGDQEEYDSHADQFFNNNTTTVSSNIAGPTQLDSLIANYFNTGWSTDNTLWSTTTIKPTDVPRPSQPILSEPVFFTNTSSPICSVPTDKKNGLNDMATRNPKKRSRVSRRAPTTVLTTDTSNFRAMVQEFTGNPSSPFTGLSPSSSSSCPFPRSRFDLFGSSSSSSSSSSRPLKPFPQKLIPKVTTTSHHYLTAPSDYHHRSLLCSMNTQNIANPFLSNQFSNNPLTDQSLLCEKSKPLFDQSLSLRTSNGFGHVDDGTKFEGIHNVIISSSSSMTKPTLKIIDGSDKNDNDMLRSINGDDQSLVQISDGYTPPVASGSENNLAAVRNEGMVELSWISSSD